MAACISVTRLRSLSTTAAGALSTKLALPSLPSLRARSKRMSRPVLAREQKVKRRASVPKAGMPSEKCLRVALFSLGGAVADTTGRDLLPEHPLDAHPRLEGIGRGRHSAPECSPGEVRIAAVVLIQRRPLP